MSIKVLLKIDKYLGKIFCLFVLIFLKINPQKKIQKIKKILIIKLTGIGDVVLALPMVEFLFKKTKAEVHFLTGKENKDLLKNQHFIKKIIIFDIKKDWINFFKIIKFLKFLKKENYDICIDLTQSSYASSLLGYFSMAPIRIGFINPVRKEKNRLYSHLVDYNDHQHIVDSYFDLLSPLGIKKQGKINLIQIKYEKKDQKKVNRVLRKENLEGKFFVGAHISSLIPSRRWDLERWAKVFEYLIKKDKNVRIIAVGSLQEKEMIDKQKNLIDQKYRKNFFNFAGKFSLSQLAYLMTKFKIFLANDGGPLHISDAMNVPTIGIFGPETPIRYGLLNKKSISLYEGYKLKCSPCTKPYKEEWPKCKDPKCLKLIKVKRVIEAVDKLLGWL